MAKSPMPRGGRRSVIVPPNEAGAGGNRANNGYLPLADAKGSVLPLNHGGDRRNGSAPQGGIPSPVHLHDHRFDVSRAKMPQPPSAIEPGKGAIPVNPWNDTGEPSHALPQPDSGRPPRR
jgi:hypothetical protein